MKLPFMQFYPDAWLRDTRKLTPQAKAVWIDIIALCWNEPERGIYQRTKRAMCHEHYLDLPELEDILCELQTVADVQDMGESVRILSRRIRKEESTREYDRNRKREYRSPDNVPENSESVTPKTLEVRSKKLDVREETTRTPLAPLPGANDFSNATKKRRRTARTIEYWQPLVDHINSSWITKKKAPYPWSPFEYAQLSQLTRIYQAWGVMALWDLYLVTETYWAKQTRYMIEGLKRDVGVLVDQPRWKDLCKQYEEKLLSPSGDNLVSVASITNGLGLTVKAIK